MVPARSITRSTCSPRPFDFTTQIISIVAHAIWLSPLPPLTIPPAIPFLRLQHLATPRNLGKDWQKRELALSSLLRPVATP